MELSSDQIRQQLQALLNPGAGDQPDGTYVPWVIWVRDLYGTYAVYQNESDGKLYRQDFTVTDLTVSLAGSPVEVVPTYATPGEASATASEGEAIPPEQPTSTLTRHLLTSMLRSGTRVFNENLQAAMVEAAQAGDAETTAAIAGILKKQVAATEASITAVIDEPPASPAAAAPPVEEEAQTLATPDDRETQVRDAATSLLGAKYPGQLVTITKVTVEDAGEGEELVSEVTFDVLNPEDETDEGTLHTVELRVAPDGTPTLGEPQEASATAEPPPATEGAGGELPGLQLSDRPTSRRRFFTPLKPTLLEEGKTATWVNVINLGTYEHDEYGTITFTEDDFNSWQKNLQAGVFGGIGPDGKPRVAADYGHAMDDPSADPASQKASGYICDLKLEGERVYALVDFTKPAAESIKNGEFSWWSVSVHPGINDKTGNPTGPVMLGGALTNRPFVPGLEAIQLSDLRPARSVQLKRELADAQAEVIKLRRKNFDGSLAITLDHFQRAGVPPHVVNLARPLLEADFDSQATIKLTRGGRTSEHKPGEVIALALLEFAKVGIVKTGEQTFHQTTSHVTLDQALEEVKAENPSVRQKDAIVLARKKYPHLRG
ncbi:phage protease [Deinococcus peraridilitoris]|uniref:Mu-like prophage I protein n=1 Tax=Deinococcus peraridilitoris (strain DSM 19664 / LMG 22246 / CIP 109416 / KR-200) TaxID=937777 RepID=K9ZZG6_DEIPD|nr:phage protease [Deinococcus peraridilitoris]AFZ66991.1 Mu-like prophage I protein [Deinococcus peraridilitoris DSM 19664]